MQSETNEYQLIVFDWDGTLMDSVAQIVSCMHAAMLDLDVPAMSEVEVKNIIGLGLREAIDQLLPERDDAFHERFAERYRHHWFNGRFNSQLFAGAEDTVRLLHAQGYRLGIATGKGRRGLDRVLGETGLAGLFHCTRCADEASSKPSPQMLQEILSETGVAAAAALVVGDSEYDLQMARGAGARSVGVSYGVHGPERLRRHAPLAILDDIRELPQWLRSAGLESS